MTFEYKMDKMRKLLYGRHGRTLIGCCGVRETLQIDATEEDLEFLRNNFTKITECGRYACNGYKNNVFNSTLCECETICGGCTEYIRDDTGTIIKDPEYNRWSFPFWGLLNGIWELPNNNVIMACLENVDYTNDYHIYHLLMILNHTIYDADIFKHIFDRFLERNPAVLLNYSWCSNKSWGKKHSLLDIILYKKRNTGSMEDYIEKLFNASKSTGIPMYFTDMINYPLPMYCLENIEPIVKEFPELESVEIYEDSPITDAVQYYSTKTLQILQSINPNMIQHMIYLFNLPEENSGIYNIINYVLAQRSNYSKVKDQLCTANILDILIESGAKPGYSYFKNCKVSTANFIEDYGYNYPGSPVMNVLSKIVDMNDYNISGKQLLVNDYGRHKENNIYKYMYCKYAYCKDPTMFNQIAKDGLLKYASDWEKAGNKFPYNESSALYPRVEQILNLEIWIDNKSDPKNIDLDITPEYADDDDDNYCIDEPDYEDVDYTVFFSESGDL